MLDVSIAGSGGGSTVMRVRSTARTLVGATVVALLSVGAMTTAGAAEKPAKPTASPSASDGSAAPTKRDVSVASAPANDNFASPTTITGSSGCETGGTTTAATTETDERLDAVETATVWYKWTAPSTATVTFTLYRLSSGTNTLAVFQGSVLSTLTLVGNYSISDSYEYEQVSFTAGAGQEYLIRPGSNFNYYLPASGTFMLDWNGGCPAPANDDFANASPLTSAMTGITSTQNNNKATFQTGEPYLSGVTDDYASVWYSWQAPSSGRVSFRTRLYDSLAGMTLFDSVLGVYTGSSFPLLGVNANDDYSACCASQVDFDAVSGTTYWFRVAGLGQALGQFVLEWGTFSDVTVTRTSPSQTNSWTVNFAVAFSEAVSGFTATDVYTALYSTLPPPTTVVVTDSGDHINYTVAVTATQDGDVGVFVVAGAATGVSSGKTNATSYVAQGYADTRVPTVGTVSGTTKGPSLTLTFSGANPGGRGGVSFECKIDSGSYTACTSPWTVGVAKGSHNAYVRVTDPAGNQTESSGFAFTIKAGKIKA